MHGKKYCLNKQTTCCGTKKQNVVERPPTPPPPEPEPVKEGRRGRKGRIGGGAGEFLSIYLMQVTEQKYCIKTH